MAGATEPTDLAVSIRAAAIGDASDVSRLLTQLGYPCDRDEAAERVSRVLSDPRQHLLVAEVDGEVIALAAMDMRYSVLRDADQARITGLVVELGQCRHGVGRRLLREVEGIARRAGAARVEVTANMRREDAHAFYRGCGYTESSRHFIKRLGD